MNTTQKRILIAVILLVAGMLMYPPFQRVASNGATYNMGYGWIFEPPGRDATVNVAILLMQWVGVLVVGGLGFFLAKGANPSTNSQGPKGVGGWLLLLVAGMLAIGPLFGAARINSAMYFVEAQFPVLKMMAEWGTYKTVMWLAFLVVAALSFYGGWGLLRGKDWSVVGRAKTVLWLVGPGGSLVLGVLIPKMTLSESNIDGGFVGGFIASVLSAAIWTVYLSKSKRVRNTYGSNSALGGTSTESASILATAPPTIRWQNRPPAPGVLATNVPSQAPPAFTTPQSVPSQQSQSAQAANATTENPPSTPIPTQTSFVVDEDAVYATVAVELETSNTDKGLWIRIYAECDGDEKKTKLAYIKQRAGKLIAAERARVFEFERQRIEQENLRKAEEERIRKMSLPHRLRFGLVPPDIAANESGGVAIKFLSACTRGALIDVEAMLTQFPILAAVVDDDGNTGLHLAVLKKHEALVISLIEHWACIGIRNKFGQTPQDIATIGCQNIPDYPTYKKIADLINSTAKAMDISDKGLGLN